MLAGGSEACLTLLHEHVRLHRDTLKRIEAPASCRPFDRGREGILLGEGAGMLVLESEARARARGARVYCELRGFGTASDAHSLTCVPEDGDVLARAIRLALADAELSAEGVDYINANGTGTQMGDPAEVRAMKAALGVRAREIPASSTKSMTGHLLGAAGGVEAIVCALAVAEGAVPHHQSTTRTPTATWFHPEDGAPPARARRSPRPWVSAATTPASPSPRSDQVGLWA